MLKTSTNKKRGFTIIELVIAMTLFSFVSVAATGAMIAVINANQLAQSKIKAMDGLSFALESMARELRVGRNYECQVDPNTATTIDGVNDCSDGKRIGFRSSEGQHIEYRLSAADVLERQIDSNGWVPMIGALIVIDEFTFDVTGSAPGSSGDTEQPAIVMRITGTAGDDPRTTAQFQIQTMITQRFPDL